MALDQNDQFYLQRPDPGKAYQKIKTTVGDLETYIVGGITTDYNDLSNRLDQEIIDREQGDNNLELQIEEVNNRLADVGSEIFAVVVNGTFKYRIAQYCKEEYQVDIAGCADITDPYLKADCLDTSLDNYHKCVANNVLYNSVGGVYLVSSVYNYENTESIFLSSSDDDGQEIVFEDIMEGDFIEVVGTKMISDGTNQIEVIDNTNYAIYEIKKTSEHVYEEVSDSPGFTTKNLHRFDVSYRNSSGKPSVNNRYFVKIMLDMERQLGKSYVQRKGDLMYGPLTVAVEHASPINGVLTTGIECRNRVSGMTLNITGAGSRGFSNLLPDLLFTSQDRVEINFTTPDQVIYDYQNAVNVVWRQSGLDFVTYYSKVPDANDPTKDVNAYMVVHDKVVLNMPAEYITAFNLLAIENNRPEVIAPKGYVDLMDEVLDAKITDINNRIDTLANASETFRYYMLPESDYITCNDALAAEQNPRDWQNGLTWGHCVGGVIQSGPGESFVWTGPFDQEYPDEDGNLDTREVDIVVLDSRSSIYEDPTNSSVTIDWDENINIGDYFEIATTAARNTAYAVYRCVEKTASTAVPQYVILTGVELFKSAEVITTGQTYKVKKYDKTSGLTLDDTEARYVKKSGDKMTGPLTQLYDPGTTTNIYTVENKNEAVDTTTRIKYSVDTDGVAKASKIAIVPSDGSSVSGQERAVLSEDYLVLQGRQAASKMSFYNANSTDIQFIAGNVGSTNVRFTINSDNINVHSRQIINVKEATRDHHALTYKWLGNNVSASSPILLNKNNSGGLEFSFDPLELNDLKDCKVGNSPVAGSVLTYDPDAEGKNKGRWVNSTTALKEFKPGNTVATTTSNNPELQQYGFYYNASTQQLFLRV